MSAEASWNPFSPAELKLVVIVMKNMKSIPDVNWDLVAQEYGYKDGALARGKFTKAKGKCKGMSSPATAGKPNNSTPPSALKRNKNSTGMADGTPSKRSRKTAKKPKDESESDFIKEEEPSLEEKKLFEDDDNLYREELYS